MKTTLTCNHEAAKSSDALWADLLPIGTQHVGPASYRGLEMPGYNLALRNCSCGSTLARPATPADAEAKAIADAQWDLALAEVAA